MIKVGVYIINKRQNSYFCIFIGFVFNPFYLFLHEIIKNSWLLLGHFYLPLIWTYHDFQKVEV
jgi:hypothetical protein